jgi:hypothetical protein
VKTDPLTTYFFELSDQLIQASASSVVNQFFLANFTQNRFFARSKTVPVPFSELSKCFSLWILAKSVHRDTRIDSITVGILLRWCTGGFQFLTTIFSSKEVLKMLFPLIQHKLQE